MNPDHLCAHFSGHLHGTCSWSHCGETLNGDSMVKSIFVGTLVRAFIGAFMGALVGIVVGPNSAFARSVQP